MNELNQQYVIGNSTPFILSNDGIVYPEEFSIMNSKKINRRKKINKLKELCDNIERESSEFFEKLRQENRPIIITEQKGKKTATIRTIIPDESRYAFRYGSCSDEVGGINIYSCDVFKCEDEYRHISSQCYFIEKDINQYKNWLNDLFYDYEKIRDRIGIKQLNDDNKSFKKMMLNTQKKLYDLQQEYIWVII